MSTIGYCAGELYESKYGGTEACRRIFRTCTFDIQCMLWLDMAAASGLFSLKHAGLSESRPELYVHRYNPRRGGPRASVVDLVYV